MQQRSERPRYLVITELFLPTKGGTAVWFDEVYRRVGGRDTHIVTRAVDGGEAHDREHANTVHRLALERHAWLRPESALIYLRFLLKSLRLAFSHRFDAVHAGRVLPEGLVAWTVARLRRIPVVVYAHGEEITTWRQPGKLRAMRFVYRHTDCVIANSEFTRDQLVALGVQPDRIVVLHPGVDTARFRPGLECSDLKASIGLREEEKLIVSVGRLSRRKGFDRVIKALPLLATRGVDARYVVIGIGEDADYLTQLAKGSGVADRVHLLGHVASDDLPRWLNAAAVFAMPNRDINGDTEGFGMVYIEAAACGKPSLAGAAGGTASAVIHGVTGLRVDGSSVEAVANGLAALVQESSLSERLSEQAMRRAREEFDWSSVAEKTVALGAAIQHPRPGGYFR